MRISQRLFLAVIPGVVGLLTVAALAYWGQYARQAPAVVVIIAVAATLASLVMAWYNIRYVTRRIERLAGAGMTATSRSSGTSAAASDVAHTIAGGAVAASRSPDELDRIESTVETLSGAVVRVRNEAQRDEKATTARANEYASLISIVASLMTARLEDAELPLHVLLSSPFGSLNENQEEMIAAAQSAIGAAGDEMRRLKKLIDLDEQAVPLILQPVNLTELLRPALAIAAAHARRAHVTFDARIPNSFPRIMVDPVHTQEALTSVFDWSVCNAGSDNAVTVEAHDSGAGEVRITVSHGTIANGTQDSIEMRIAARLLSLQLGRMTREPGRIHVDLPLEEFSATRKLTSPSTRGG